jgi:hypothetical protein
MNHYTNKCTENCELILEAVPGAEKWPRRLVCEKHGYPSERNKTAFQGKPDEDRPNNYIQEIASPADVYEIGGQEVSQY